MIRNYSYLHKIASQSEFSQVGATEPLKYADTRFGTEVIMGWYLLSTKGIYRNLFVHPEMEAWVERQKPKTQDKFRKVSDATYVEHRRVDTQQEQEQIGTTKCRKHCSCP